MNLLVLQTITLILGISATLFSFYAAGHFARCKVSLSKAIAWTLVGEGVMGFMTSCFAFMELVGYLPYLSSEVATAMRITMFAFTSVTTGLLVVKMHEVEDG